MPPDATAEPPADDGALLEALKDPARRDEAFEQLFARYFRSVFRSLRRRQGISAEQAEELTQETFLRVYRGAEGFRGDSRLGYWIFGIAMNLWRNALRDRHAHKRNAPEDSLDAVLETQGTSVEGGAARDRQPPDPLDRVLADERLRRLRAAILELPPQMRRCLLLRIDQELPYRDIATLMRTSIQTVKSQLHHAQQRLREILSDQLAVPEL